MELLPFGPFRWSSSIRDVSEQLILDDGNMRQNWSGREVEEMYERDTTYNLRHLYQRAQRRCGMVWESL